MEELINFQIKDFGPINECDMKIGRINIIGGPNASGKSTASKLVYCLLKASCNQRQEFAYDSISTSIRRINSRLSDMIRTNPGTRDFFELFEEYKNLKEEYYSSSENQSKFIDREIQYIDNTVEEIQHNGDSFYISLLQNLFRIEFSKKIFNGFISFNDKLDKDSLINVYEFLKMDLDLEETIDDSYKPNNYLDIYDVFYMDSFSIFDLDRIPIGFNRRMGYYDHVDYLRLIIRDIEEEYGDNKKHSTIIDVEEKIEDIIGGKFELDNRRFNFKSKENGPLRVQDTASGIKQIGVIQLLLASRKLKEDSFLIIDEPEVNLHPEWQFKLAEILVLLAKDLNISLYINTHSPMFIEAMEVFTKYYDLQEDTYYYLSELDADNAGYKIKNIDLDDIYELYDNLASPYDIIDNYRLKANLKQNDS